MIRCARSDLFSSCFELPSPARVASPECHDRQPLFSPRETPPVAAAAAAAAAKLSAPPSADDREVFVTGGGGSLPVSPTFKVDVTPKEEEGGQEDGKDVMARYFEDQMFEGRVQLLRRLYSGGCWVTQDDTALVPETDAGGAGQPAAGSASEYPKQQRRRHGSCESGFFSSGTSDRRHTVGSCLNSAPILIKATP